MSTKAEVARASVARLLLGLDNGDRLPRTQDMAQTAGVGLGTVQTALDALQASGAVTLTSHGAARRRVVASDVCELWKHSGRLNLTGVMPLPQSRQFAGLATGIGAHSGNREIPIQLLFRQGSDTRIRLLEAGIVDFLVMSASAKRTREDQLDFIDLGRGTYSRPNAVLLSRRWWERTSGHRVGVDTTSSDHLIVSRREFPDGNFVHIPYLFIPEAVLTGRVDAAVWHKTSWEFSPNSELEIRDPMHSDSDDELGRAVIAWPKDDVATGRIIQSALDIDEIIQIQAEVIEGSRVPEF